VPIARCDKCSSPIGLKFSYPHRHVAKDGLRLMCGAFNCAQPADVWLSDAEQAEYVRGERFFLVAAPRYRKIELS